MIITVTHNSVNCLQINRADNNQDMETPLPSALPHHYPHTLGLAEEMYPLTIIFLSTFLSPPLVLSSPDLPWTQEETLIVRAKLEVVFNSRAGVAREYLKI